MSTVGPDIETSRTLRRDLITGILGAWLLLSVFLDGWAHMNLDGAETFFTPWHAALYAGLGMMSAWVAGLAWRGRRPDAPLARALPQGYGVTVTGIAAFSLGGLLDLAWHEVFGIEVALDALVSPTHLLLGAGGLLILGTGLRSQRASKRSESWRWTTPAMLSLLLVTALAAFFLIYTSAFVMSAPTREFVPLPEGAPGHGESELPVIAALAGYIVTTVLLIVPVLLVLTSGSPAPRLTVTTVAATVAWLSVAMVGFPAGAVAGAAGATLGAGLADVARVWLPVRLDRRRLPIEAAAIAGLLWAGQLAGLAVAQGLRWPVSLWLGAVVLSGGVAAGLAVLRGPAVRHPMPTPAAGKQTG